MKTSRLRYVAMIALLIGTVTAHAVPVTYSTRFDAIMGPSGTGSFLYDADTGSLTNLVWDFGGGIVGGFSVVEFPNPFRPYSSGALLAEILTQTDLAPGIDCIGPPEGRCSSTRGGSLGMTPGNVNGVSFRSSSIVGAAFYSFAEVTFTPPIPGSPPAPPVFGPSVANGYITAFVAVPEPEAVTFLMLMVVLKVSSMRSRVFRRRGLPDPTISSRICS
jgi:hypothetical protein